MCRPSFTSSGSDSKDTPVERSDHLHDHSDDGSGGRELPASSHARNRASDPEVSGFGPARSDLMDLILKNCSDATEEVRT